MTASTASSVSAAFLTWIGVGVLGSRLDSSARPLGAPFLLELDDTFRASCEKVPLLKRFVDGDGGLHPFRRRHDDKLRVPRSIAGHEDARDVRAQSVPVFTVPRRVSVQPSRIARFD